MIILLVSRKKSLSTLEKVLRSDKFTIQIDHQPDATISPVFCLTFIYRPTALLSPCSESKPEAATAVVELLMTGATTPETCWAVNKRQVKYWRNCCIWLVIYLNCMMMHGLANFKLDKLTFQIISIIIPFSLWDKTRANLTLQYVICSLGQQNLHGFGTGRFPCSGM
jgi:hypothetical protein